MNDKLKPALIGGVVLGLLSAIPFVNWVNICCCLWAILGGMLASYLYIKNSPKPANAGDGAVLGVLAGLVGGIVSFVLGVPIQMLAGAAINGILIGFVEGMNPSQAEMLRQQMLAGQTIAGAIINGLVSAVFLFIFSIIGGLIGVPIFEKRKGDMTPPPPPNMGGVGGYAA